MISANLTKFRRNLNIDTKLLLPGEIYQETYDLNFETYDLNIWFIETIETIWFIETYDLNLVLPKQD